MTKFDTMINYSQFNIFREGAKAGNDWTSEHMAQGFSYREDCVSFGVPQDIEWVRVEMQVVDLVPPMSDATLLRIVVPWLVGADHSTCFSNPLQATDLNVPAGSYALIYDLLPGFEDGDEDHEGRIVLTFARMNDPMFSIDRQHPGNPSAEVLVRTAEPAL